MRNTEQTLSTAIGELRCLSPHRPASLDELVALRAARDCIDELLRSCVAELRADAKNAAAWTDIAYALDSPSAGAARQLYGAHSTLADKQVLWFWEAFADRFAWDFLPASFLHALYIQWMSVEFPEGPRFSKETFTRRLKAAAEASGQWAHTRSRPGSLTDAAEPLAAALPGWTYDGSGRAVYGLRRNGTVRKYSRVGA